MCSLGSTIARVMGLWVMATALLLGCSSADIDDDTADGGPPIDLTSGTTAVPGTSGGQDGTTGDPGMTSTPSDDTTSAGTTGTPATDDGFIFDLGMVPDSPPLETGCGKVDFLFVVDNSGSMSAQQTQLLASFSGFINAIQASLEGTVDSYHVGVLTSDAYTANEPGCTGLGDLVTQTSAGGVCGPFAEGGRYATEMDDLEVVFPCMAQVGTFGSGLELPVSATVASFDPAKTGPGGCNEGFLRDDAILVLIVLTDDPPYDGNFDDAHPMAMTAGWHDAVVNAKNGDPEALVVIGFVPWMNVSCVVFNIESPNLINFVMSFGDQSEIASICEPDFGPIFAQTVDTIVTTCQNFEPPA